jgi:quinoprotein dehydrogenase-associated probable ABC transporter substrate-binding protein
MVVLAVAALVLATTAGCDAPPGHARSGEGERVLRVCADPNNLPFSNDRLEGFENRLAALVAGALKARVEYTWWAQRRGFLRNTLNAGRCDVVMGLASGVELALVTRPYYRSTYVFVTRSDDRLALSGFDDPRLARLRVGVQLVGDDFANTPPAHALSRRGLIRNVVGFSVYGDYREPNPPARIVQAVARGEIDVAVAWGPLAGYFAPRQARPLALRPVSPQVDLPFLPFVYDISMAVRRGEESLKAEIERVLDAERDRVDALLDAFGVPRIDTRRAAGVEGT